LRGRQLLRLLGPPRWEARRERRRLRRPLRSAPLRDGRRRLRAHRHTRRGRGHAPAGAPGDGGGRSRVLDLPDRPAPRRGRTRGAVHASAEEIVALAGVLAEFDHGALEIIPRSFAEGFDEKDRALLLEMYRVSGKPIELNILV